MSILEEYLAKERIRHTMETDLFDKIMSLADDDHFHILNDSAPVEYWGDSLTVQVWIKLGLIKKKG